MVGGVGIKKRRMKVKNGFISKLHWVGGRVAGSRGREGREGGRTKEESEGKRGGRRKDTGRSVCEQERDKVEGGDVKEGRRAVERKRKE